MPIKDTPLRSLEPVADCSACQREADGLPALASIPHVHSDLDYKTRCCLRRFPYVSKSRPKMGSKVLRCEDWRCLCPRCKGCGLERVEEALSRLYGYFQVAESVWVRAVNLTELARSSDEQPTCWEHWASTLSGQVTKRARSQGGACRVVVASDERGELIAYVFADVDLSLQRVKKTSLARDFKRLEFETAWALLHSVLVVGQTRKVLGSRNWPVREPKFKRDDYRALITPVKYNHLTDEQLTSMKTLLSEQLGGEVVVKGKWVSAPEGWTGTAEEFADAAEWAARREKAWDTSGEPDGYQERAA